ncbi:pathogenesis-related transcriptional activator PTI6-like protein [Carex littledalei]|uniref:Pathogenesis-related transcriptional activator PTI6-like protein n=1 Tax=Carex littledalei TaxID=544730 RepID=A0A833R132_9POAL|nr:pathogenesis-related transcriptional activator PTI6-like protein [Carex littledalei]
MEQRQERGRKGKQKRVWVWVKDSVILCDFRTISNGIYVFRSDQDGFFFFFYYYFYFYFFFLYYFFIRVFATTGEDREVCFDTHQILLVRVYLSDPDATDSDSDSNSDSLERSQHKSQNQNQNQKKNQNSSKYKGVTLRESGKWAAQIWVRGVCVWLGTFPSEEEAHQAYQAAHNRIKKEKAQIVQGKKTQLYQKGEERREGAAAIQIKKEEEKAEKEVTTAVVSPPVKKRKRTNPGRLFNLSLLFQKKNRGMISLQTIPRQVLTAEPGPPR